MNLRGFIDRIRKPKWVPLVGNGLAHDDWRVGDLAKCVATGGWFDCMDGHPTEGPRYGDVLRVSAVGMTEGWHWLAFEGFERTWVAECFLKIRPLNRQACTRDFACLLKSIDRKVDA